MSSDTIQPYHGSYLMPSLEHATVSDAMHPGILSCRPDASATEMARMMATHHVHCIAVSGRSRDPSGESRIWGIISDLDLIQAGIDNDPTRPPPPSRGSRSSPSSLPRPSAKPRG